MSSFSPILFGGIFYSRITSATPSGEWPTCSLWSYSPFCLQSVLWVPPSSEEVPALLFSLAMRIPFIFTIILILADTAALSFDELLQLEVAQLSLWESAVHSHLIGMSRFLWSLYPPLVTPAAGVWSLGLQTRVFSSGAPHWSSGQRLKAPAEASKK